MLEPKSSARMVAEFRVSCRRESPICALVFGKYDRRGAVREGLFGWSGASKE